jgi:hypothetical protein
MFRSAVISVTHLTPGLEDTFCTKDLCILGTSVGLQHKQNPPEDDAVALKRVVDNLAA